jgi:hypothetical protein
MVQDRYIKCSWCGKVHKESFSCEPRCGMQEDEIKYLSRNENAGFESSREYRRAQKKYDKKFAQRLK